MSENIENKETAPEIKKVSVTESPDHIIGIVSSGKLHVLEDNIMSVVNSKIREKIDMYKEQVRITAGIKE